MEYYIELIFDGASHVEAYITYPTLDGLNRKYTGSVDMKKAGGREAAESLVGAIRRSLQLAGWKVCEVRYKVISPDGGDTLDRNVIQFWTNIAKATTEAADA